MAPLKVQICFLYFSKFLGESGLRLMILFSSKGNLRLLTGLAFIGRCGIIIATEEYKVIFMQEILLGIITITLIILTIELSIVFYYAIIFFKNAFFISQRIKILEGDFEQKMENLEAELTLFSAKLVKTIFQRLNKFLKPNKTK